MTRHIGAAVLAVFLTTASNCLGAKIDSVFSKDILDLYEDMVVSAASIVDTDKININRSIIIENQGIVYGDIYVTGRNHVYIENSGQFRGTIYLAPTAQLTQIVTKPDDMVPLNVASPYTVLIRNRSFDDGVRVSDILALGKSVDEIILENAYVILDVPWPTGENTPRINTVGEIMFKKDEGCKEDVNVLVPNTSGNGSVIVMAPKDESIQSPVVGRDEENNLVLDMKPQTDYQQVLGFGPQGKFLNALRETMPDDPLIQKLMTAQTREEINDILHHSVRTNPMNLMNLARPLLAFELSDGFKTDGLDINGSYLFGDAKGPALSVGLGFKGDMFSIGVRGHGAHLAYHDEINNYNAWIGGGDVRGQFDSRYVWARAAMGMSYAKFDIGPVFDGLDVAVNPDGRTLYGVMDVGAHIGGGSAWSWRPYVGVMGKWDKLMAQTRRRYISRGGMDIEYSMNWDSIRTTVGIHGSVDSDHGVVGAMTIDVWSKYDALGGYGRFDIYSDDILTSYRATLGGRMAF